jgi:hypothetical protein
MLSLDVPLDRIPQEAAGNGAFFPFWEPRKVLLGRLPDLSLDFIHYTLSIDED